MDAGIIPSLDSPLLLLATEPEAAALTVQQKGGLAGLTQGSKFMGGAASLHRGCDSITDSAIRHGLPAAAAAAFLGAL